MIRCEVLAGAGEGRCRTRRRWSRSASLSTDSTVSERSASSVSVAIGVRVFSVAISESSSRYGSLVAPAAGARRTARRRPTGCRRARACRPGSRRSPCRSSRWTSTPSSVSSSLLDLADPDAAVGDLAAGEDAAGVGEVRDHGVGVVEEQPVELGVAGADEADAEQRDDHEDQQLDLGAAGDHRVTIPGHEQRRPAPGRRRPSARRSSGHSPVGRGLDRARPRQAGDAEQAAGARSAAPSPSGRDGSPGIRLQLLADGLVSFFGFAALARAAGQRPATVASTFWHGLLVRSPLAQALEHGRRRSRSGRGRSAGPVGRPVSPPSARRSTSSSIDRFV